MLTITFEDGASSVFDLTDPNNGIISPNLHKSRDGTYTQKEMMEYAHQIATVGYYVLEDDETLTYYSPECICSVNVPACLNVNEVIETPPLPGV